MSLIRDSMSSDRNGPVLIRYDGARDDLRRLLEVLSTSLDAELREHGAVLFRGFPLRGVKDFETVVDALPYDKLDYTYRSTPRTSVGANVYTATEYPAVQRIPLHNENAYQRRWPMKLAFFCEHPAQAGGETPIANLDEVTAGIGTAIVDEFESRGVQYVRHYHPFIDIPWQTVFQCRDKSGVASFCADQDIQHSWLPGDVLRTTQICQGAAYHPHSGNRVFFNQAHLFHASSLGVERAQSLRNVFGADRLPRHARFGDEQEIPVEQLEVVRGAFDRRAVSFAWEAGDILVLDNMRFAHGRQPFSGTRRVYAALLDPIGAEQSSRRVEARSADLVGRGR